MNLLVSMIFSIFTFFPLDLSLPVMLLNDQRTVLSFYPLFPKNVLLSDDLSLFTFFPLDLSLPVMLLNDTSI